MKAIRTAIIPIMGFTQTIGRNVGMIKLWRELRELSAEDRFIAHPQRWCANWSDMAEFLHGITQNGGDKPTIYVAAYSWGGGWGFIRLAKELKKRGLHIAKAVLCDPVYRSRWHLLKWRSLVNKGPLAPKIVIPSNVENVWYFFQRQNKPQAHRLVPQKEGYPVLHPGIEAIMGLQPGELEANHEFMDDQPEFREKVLELFWDVKPASTLEA
jgi:hypothetical protein